MPPTDPSLTDRRSITAAVQRALAATLRARRAELDQIAPEAGLLVDRLETFIEGGKLLRPLFCALGGAAASAHTEKDLEALAGLGAAIELVQAAALMHDDVMDHSPTRRGRPAVHVAAASEHTERGLHGNPTDHGASVAIILGDLALTWADRLVAETLSSWPEPDAARNEYHLLCTEVMAGQYLDMLHQDGGFISAASPEEAAMAVIRWKTVPYTVLRPLRMGAALMGADTSRQQALSDYALEVGTAFQLRDDLLGVFGDEEVTGKSASSDISEGKATVLLALGRDRATGPERAELEAIVGRSDAGPEHVERVRQILRATGAAAEVGHRIREGRDRARAILAADATMPPAAQEALAELADYATSLEGLRLS